MQAQFHNHPIGWLGIVGAIDCTHVVISKPGGAHGRRWRDRNSNFSSVVQAVAAPDLKFYDVYVGFPGAAHDQRVFDESPLGQSHFSEEHAIYRQPLITFNNFAPFRPYLLGDAGYRLQENLVVPYSRVDERTPLLRTFNFRLSSQRMCVERAFGHLKSVFRILCGADRVLRAKEDRIPTYIMSCVISHNWLKGRGFAIDETEVEQMQREERARPRVMQPQPNDGSTAGERGCARQYDRCSWGPFPRRWSCETCTTDVMCLLYD